MHFVPFTTKEAQHLVCLLGFWISNYILRIVFQSIYLATWITDSFEWGPEQEKVLEQVLAVVLASLLLEPYNLLEPMVLELPMIDENAVWNFCQLPKERHNTETFHSRELVAV